MSGFTNKIRVDILKDCHSLVNTVNLNRLCGNSDADQLHTHPLSNISDVTASFTEVNTLDGILATTNELNFTTGLTGSIQDQLNNHLDGTTPFTNIDVNGGTINGLSSPLAVVDGGTGGDTAGVARTNLGLSIGSDVQAYDEQLDEVSLITPNNGVFIIGDSANLTSFTGDNVLGKIGTTATIANLDDLTDGTNSDSLHVHTSTGITDFNTSADGRVTYEALDGNSDVGLVANTVAAGDDFRFPTSSEKAAMTNASTPTGLNPFATVADLSFGTVWRDPVLDFYDPTPNLPLGPTLGDRYISSATANTWTIHRIYEYNGATWDEYTPVESWSVWNETLDEYYNYNDTNQWVSFGSVTTHNNTKGLQGGTTDEYYHLTSTQHVDLTTGIDGSTQHNHGSLYYTETETDSLFANVLDGTTDFTRLDVDNLVINTNTVNNVTQNNYLDLNDDGTTTLISTNSQPLVLNSASQEYLFNNTLPVIQPFNVNTPLTIKSTGTGDLSLIPGTSGSLIVNNDPVIYSTSNLVSFQTNTNKTCIEILNNVGTNQGVFLGILNNDFEMKNYQAGNIHFYTHPSVSNGTLQLILDTAGDLDLKNGNFDIQSGDLELDSITRIDNAGIFYGTGLLISNSTSYSEIAIARTIGIDTFKTVLTVGGAGESLISNYKDSTQQGFIKLAENGQIILTSLINQDLDLTVSGTGNINIPVNDLEMGGLTTIRSDRSFNPPSLADSSASNNSFYYSTDHNCLVYKNSTGEVCCTQPNKICKKYINNTNYTLLSSDYVILYTNLSLGRTITIPNSLLSLDQKWIIKDGSGSANLYNITIDPEGSTTIDGQGTFLINSNYTSITICSDSTNWFII